MIVSLLVVPVAGAMADRINPLGLLKRCHLLSLLWSAIFFVSIVSGIINIYLLMALVIAKATSSAFSQPVGMSMVNNLIARNRDHLGPAISINATIFHLGRIIGPAMAGAVIAGFGVASVFAVGFLGYAIFVATLHYHVVLQVPVKPTSHSPILRDIAEGLHYAYRHPRLMQIFLLGIAASFLLRPYADLLPSIAEVMFNRGAAGLAILAAASGAGGMIGSLYILFQPGRKHMLRTTANIALLTAFFLFAFAQSNLLWAGFRVTWMMNIEVAVSAC
jgi:MFS family permease